MKIVREHINEIKRDSHGSSLGNIGVGSKVYYGNKLSEFIEENLDFFHKIHNNKHGHRIAKILNLPINSIIEVVMFVDPADDNLRRKPRLIEKLEEKIDLPYTEFTKYNRTYRLWKLPSFILEIKNDGTEYIIYCSKSFIKNIID